MAAEGSTIIAACGNPDAGEDAFGPLVARRLAGSRLAAQVVHVGTDATALLDHLDGATTLILVDAAWWPDATAGTVIDIDWRSEARPALAGDQPGVSTHGISISAALALAEQLNILPRKVRLVAAAVQNVQPGAAANPMFAESVRLAARRIGTLLKQADQDRETARHA